MPSVLEDSFSGCLAFNRENLDCIVLQTAWLLLEIKQPSIRIAIHFTMRLDNQKILTSSQKVLLQQSILNHIDLNRMLLWMIARLSLLNSQTSTGRMGIETSLQYQQYTRNSRGFNVSSYTRLFEANQTMPEPDLIIC